MKEGWGITNIEASSCGTPVVSANVPGLRDSVSEGKSGLLYKYGDIEDLTSKLRSILTDKDLFVKLQNGSVSWAKEFSWDLSAKKMEELIFKTINNFKR
jgi:glycosyltransferase involved in cell wall biosynthesis